MSGLTENGCWRLTPKAAVRSSSRRYQHDTLVLETDLETDEGAVRLIDFMPEPQRVSSLVRIVVGLRGRVVTHSELRLRFDYGSLPLWCEGMEEGTVFRIGPDMMVLRAPVPMKLHQHCQEAEFHITEGQRIALVLSHGSAALPVPEAIDAEQALTATQSYWRQWIARFEISQPSS